MLHLGTVCMLFMFLPSYSTCSNVFFCKFQMHSYNFSWNILSIYSICKPFFRCSITTYIVHAFLFSANRLRNQKWTIESIFSLKYKRSMVITFNWIKNVCCQGFQKIGFHFSSKSTAFMQWFFFYFQDELSTKNVRNLKLHCTYIWLSRNSNQ